MKRKLSPWCKEVKKTLIDRDMSVTELCGEVAKKIKNKKIIGSKFAMSTIAYNGWFVTTDSFLVRVAECWDQLISMAKNIISRYAKQKSYAMEKYYKKWRKLNYA